jgi:hypothetical protein
MRDDEREIDADEDYEDELDQSLPRVDRVRAHRCAGLTEIGS